MADDGHIGETLLARVHGAGFAATLAWLRSLPRSEAEAVLWPNDPRPVGEEP